jgi:hypothetical protein
MKKLFISLTAIVLVAGMPFGQTQSTTFNLSLYLNEYIETMPGPVDVNLGHTWQRNTSEVYGMGGPDPWDFAYANCPFRITISGDNPAGEGKPRFARLETGTHANGYDTLPTRWWIFLQIDGVDDYRAPDAKNFPYSWEHAEAPHNGQIKLKFNIYTNWEDVQDSIPIRHTTINPAFAWQDSADAGLYTCSVVVTLGAL